MSITAAHHAARSWSAHARMVLSAAVAVAGLVVTGTATAASASAAGAPASAAVRTAGSAGPAAGGRPAVAYASTCYASKTAAAGPACQRVLVADINTARAREGVPPLVLPRGYATLPAGIQVFVLTDLERVDRGLAPLVGMNDTLNARARLGAAAGSDPSIATSNLDSESGQIWTANQVADANALEADWLWMYADGWAGADTSNVDCTSARSSGCWGHRHNVLARYPGAPVLVTGTAAVSAGPFTSYAQLVLAGTGRAPSLTYTWARALAAGADRH